MDGCQGGMMEQLVFVHWEKQESERRLTFLQVVFWRKTEQLRIRTRRFTALCQSVLVEAAATTDVSPE